MDPISPIPSLPSLPIASAPVRTQIPAPTLPISGAIPPGTSTPPPTSGQTPQPLNPLAPSLISSIEGINFDENATNAGVYNIPPDPHGAVGPGHVVSVVNTSIEWHTKAGVQQNSQSLRSFFNNVPNTGTFDPKVIYDHYAGRFLVVSLEQQGRGDSSANPANDRSRIYLAVSDDSDPNGNWYRYEINSLTSISGVNYWADYPGFAVDEEAVYITNNMFQFDGAGSFGGSRLWIVPKSPFYNGGTASNQIYDPSALAGSGGGGTMQPAHMYGTPVSASLGTFLTTTGWTSGSNELLSVIRIDNPLGSPTFSNQFVNVGDIDTGTGLSDAPQLGTSTRIETNDLRALNAVWRNNNLYVVNTVNPPSGPDAGQATAHWYRIDTTNLNSLAVGDQGNIGGEDIAAGTYTFMPSIAVDSSDNVAVGFAASASTIYPGAYYTGRSVTDTPGTMQPAGVIRSGQDYYIRTFGGPRNRWGDYSAVTVDPTDNSFWAFNEYALTRGTTFSGEDGRWGTAFGNFTFTSGVSTINGTGGDDNLLGTSSGEAINGLVGNDTITGAGGSDTLSGGPGNDFFRFADPSDGADTFTDFTIGSDKIYINADSFNAGAGALIPSTPLSTYSPSVTTGSLYIGSFGNVLGLNAGASASAVFAFSTADRRLWVDRDGSAGTYKYQLLGTLNTGVTLSPSDFVVYGGASVITGSSGADSLTGTAAAETISALAGNDTITGAGGNDTLIGGTESDFFKFDGPSEGSDTFVDFTPGTDKIYINANNFNAGAGGLVAGTSLVAYNPSTTTGTLFVGNFGNVAGVNAGASAGPTFAYSTTDRRLWVDRDGSGGSNTYQQLGTFGTGVTLSPGDFVVYSSAAPGSVITGTAGPDSLTGGTGNDTIIGAAGNDTLVGNNGSDFFRFDFANEGTDRLTDFVPGVDKIQIDASNFNAGTGGLVGGTGLVPYNTSVTTGSLYVGNFGNVAGVNAGPSSGPTFAYSTTDQRLWVDRDGSNGGFTYQLLAQFNAGVVLTAGDFAVIP